jgi:hypothetical protein
MANRRAASAPGVGAAPRDAPKQEAAQVSPGEILYDTYVPEILVDGITTAFVANGIVRLALVSVQNTGPNIQQPRIVLRLAIPLASFPQFQQAVNSLWESITDANPRS